MILKLGFPGGTMIKSPPAITGDEGDLGAVLGSGGSPGERNGSLLQYSCLENLMDEEPGPLQSMGVTKSQTRLSN